MHEAVLEDRLADMRAALGQRHQRHELRLEVRGKAGERVGGHIHRRDAGAVAADADAVRRLRHLGPRGGEDVEGRVQEVGAGVLEQHVAARHRHRHGIGAGLDPVGQDLVPCAVEARDALDGDARRAGALDPGAHLGEAGGEIHHLRLAGRVLDEGRALGQGGRHQRHVGAPDRDLGKHDLGPAQAVLGLGDDVAAIDLDRGSEALQRHQEQVHRTGADGAAAGHRDLGLAEAGQQRRDDPEARPHGRNEVVGRRGVDDVGGGEPDGLPGLRGLTRALADDHVVDAVIAQDAQQRLDVGEARHVGEFEGLPSEQAGDHQGQGRVLRA